jgi:1-acyl-sn-glycerol-3-phosphate acyltransferase
MYCQWIFEFAGGRVTVHGLESIPFKESAFIISNHRSFGDWIFIHAVAIRRGMLGYCRYFSKDSVKWIPFFGWGIRMMGMIMLKRNWTQDWKRIMDTFGLYTRHVLPLWLVSYSEGSRWTVKKAAACQEYARLNDRHSPDYVLLPRTRGFVTSIKALRDRLKAVYDFTLVYHKGRKNVMPPIYAFLFGWLGDYEFDLYIQRYPIESLPSDEDALSDWLHDRFVEKDRLLKSIYS